MIKAVLFDFDGTIVDTNELILNSWRHLYKTVLGRECRDEEVTVSFGEALWDSVRDRFPGYNTDELVDIYRKYNRQIFLEQVKIYPGMKELLVELKRRGIKTAVVTSRGITTSTMGIEKYGLADYLDVIITCEDTDAHKPDPLPCQIAMDRLSVKPDECIMIGDSRLDIQCAHNAGVKGVLVNWTICCPEKMRVENSKPDYIIDKAEEILDLL